MPDSYDYSGQTGNTHHPLGTDPDRGAAGGSEDGVRLLQGGGPVITEGVRNSSTPDLGFHSGKGFNGSYKAPWLDRSDRIG